MKSFAIIGGGIVGLAVAHQLLKKTSHHRVTVLEKESQVGRHQSTHNSGVLHSGLYYQPGSLKAQLSVSGIRLMTQFCKEHDVAHEICGKIVTAVSPQEIPRLKNLFERGHQNGLKGLAWLAPHEIKKREPHAAGLAAILVPEEGIVDYAGVCEALRKSILSLGGEIRLNFCVDKLTHRHAAWLIESKTDKVEASFLINCAGLQSDRMGTLATRNPSSRIIPFRGDYYKLKPEREYLVRHLIYPVPDPKFPFLGVHFTRLVSGGVEAGPNAVLAFKREAYTKTGFSSKDTWDTFAFSGFWKFATRHFLMCGQELGRAFSRRLFCSSLQRLVPDLREDDLMEGGCGIRAQSITREGNLQQDFDIVQDATALHVFNAPSPAATASLAIANEILRRMEKSINY